MEKILEVKNLITAFYTEHGKVNAVDDVSFSVFEARTLGIVGESGCGKTVTSLSIMRLIPSPGGEIISGEILYKGQNLARLSEKEMRSIRGNKISMIFQEPMTSLNPVFTIGNQLSESFLVHQSISKKEAKVKAIEMLQLVGIPEPSRRYDEYPHQLSGGMRQRVMIAMALACKPALLIADEPTTALDVTIQAQILELMKKLQNTLGMAMILITHDLGIVAENADDVAVMYAGKIVEQGSVEKIFSNPQHPYTRGLLRSTPKFLEKKDSSFRLEAIPGIVPALHELPSGCRFQTRCPNVIERCRKEEPKLVQLSSDQAVACFNSGK